MERRLSKIETLTLAKNYIINLTHIILAKRNEESALEFNGVLMNGNTPDGTAPNNVVGDTDTNTLLGVNGNVNGGIVTNGNVLVGLPACYDDANTYNCTLLADHQNPQTQQPLTTATTTIQIQQNQPLNHMHHQSTSHHVMISNHSQLLMPQQQQTTAQQQQQQQSLQQTAILMNGYADSTGDNNNFDEPFREFL